MEFDLPSLLRDLREASYVFIEENERAVWPVAIIIRETKFTLDWWLDPFREKATHLKCWAGQVTTGKLIGELTGE